MNHRIRVVPVLLNADVLKLVVSVFLGRPKTLSILLSGSQRVQNIKASSSSWLRPCASSWTICLSCSKKENDTSVAEWTHEKSSLCQLQVRFATSDRAKRRSSEDVAYDDARDFAREILKKGQTITTDNVTTSRTETCAIPWRHRSLEQVMLLSVRPVSDSSFKCTSVSDFSTTISQSYRICVRPQCSLTRTTTVLTWSAPVIG